jgi:hypothetical protein
VLTSANKFRPGEWFARPGPVFPMLANHRAETPQKGRTIMFKRICRAGLLVALTTIAIVGTEQQAAATKKPIIILYASPKSIEPIALTSPNGRQVVVELGGPTVTGFAVTKISATVVVYQESTGAVGQGIWHSPMLPPDAPETVTFPVLVNAQGDSRFEEGPALACYFAEERVKGQVVRTWSHCEEIQLLQLP